MHLYIKFYMVSLRDSPQAFRHPKASLTPEDLDNKLLKDLTEERLCGSYITRIQTDSVEIVSPLCSFCNIPTTTSQQSEMEEEETWLLAVATTVCADIRLKQG